MPPEPLSPCDLTIPNKDWVRRAAKWVPGLSKIAQLEFDNLNAIEQWARRFRRDCIGGGGSGLALYSSKEWEFIGSQAEVNWSVIIPSPMTLVCIWSWYVDYFSGSYNIRAYGTFDSFTSQAFGNDGDYSGDFSAEASGSTSAVVGQYDAGSYTASLVLYDVNLISGEIGHCSLTVLGFVNPDGASIS